MRFVVKVVEKQAGEVEMVFARSSDGLDKRQARKEHWMMNSVERST